LLLSRDTVEFNWAADHWLDVGEFTALLDACDAHPHRRREACPHCARRLEQAAALYRGQFLAGFSIDDSAAFEEWALGRREWLLQRALGALAWLADYHEHRGTHERVGEYARRQLALDPWREGAHRQLMRALAASGQRGAALAQYERCRTTLAEELGCEPEAATTALYRQIKDGGVAPDPRPAPRPGVAPPQLPAQPGPLIGRERELAELAALLADPACRLVTLVGPGGIGKTRLGIQAAADQGEACADGVCFVPLAPLRSADLLVTAIANALELTSYGQQGLEDQLLEELRERELLLVLDNAEHLLEGAPLLAAILQRAPDVKLLVTSRERLDVREEWAFAVDGLSVPAAGETDGIEDHGAVRLFVQRARQVEARFALRPEDRPDVARICRLVGGMPLAIELAAAWVAVLPCAEIAREIERNLDVLATTLRDVPARHRDMRAVFDHSWRLLTEHQRDVFRQLSVFRGGFLRAAAAEVAGASLFTLSALVSKSFLRKTPAERYEIHELLRQYAQEQLETSPREAEGARDRHCDYYMEFLARRAESLQGAAQQAALQEIGAEIENVRAAWRRAIDRGQAGLVARAADALWLFYQGHGRSMEEGEEAFGRALAALEQLPCAEEGGPAERDVALGKALARQGSYRYRRGAYEQAAEFLGRSIALFRRLDAPQELGLSLNLLAGAVHLLGDYAEERRLLREGIALSQAAGDRWCAAYSLNDLGLVTHLLGDDAEAQRLCKESLAIFEGIGDRRGRAFALNNLGEVAAQRGEHAEAERLHRESLALRRASGDLWGMAGSLIQLGVVARLRGAHRESRTCLLEALRTARESRALPLVLEALVELAA
ncbi:MAG TPA: BTAD domain-containing putative transcriptional regulator, partial [Vicinamibacteria bacterium]